MAVIDLALVEHVAHLARLDLAPGEKERLLEQVNRILEHVRKIQELNTDGVEPTFHVLEDLKNVTRPDDPWESVPRDEALGQAPDAADGFYRVPRVI